jgi:hypothetical protein
MAESLLIPLSDVEGESLGWDDDDYLLLLALLASDVERADRYWRLIAPPGYEVLTRAARIPDRTALASQSVWFDVDEQRYGLRRSYIKRDAYRNAVRKAISNAEGRAVRLTRSLAAGALPVDQWQTAMATEIRQASAAFAVVGAGGPEGVTTRIIADVEKRLTFQFKRLEVYAKQLELKEPAVARTLESRPSAYMRHTGTTHAEAERISHDEAGFIEEMNVLSPADHCKARPKDTLPDCPSLSEKGWQPIGTLAQVGSRICRMNCLCSFAFRKRPGRVSEN